MKKFSIILTAAALILGATQCTKENIQNIPGDEGVYVTLTAGFDQGMKTTVHPTGIVQWSAGDKIYMIGATDGYLGELTTVNYSDSNPSAWAEFGGNVTAPSVAQDIHFYYFGRQGLTAAQISALQGGTTTYSYSISSQDGSLAGIAQSKQLMHVLKTGVAAGTTRFGSVTMSNMIAIARFDISGYCTSAKCDGAYSQATLNLKTGVLGGLTQSQITLTPASASESPNFYMVLLPGTQTLTFNSAAQDDPVAQTEHTVVSGSFFSDNGKSIVVKNTVNLGLPSPYQNLEFATNNMGATSETTDESWYGNYYAWGETKHYHQVPNPYEPSWTGNTNVNYQTLVTDGMAKTSYSWEYYKWGIGTGIDNDNVTDVYKYNSTDGKTILDPADDAATAFFGGEWRIPTKDEWVALFDNCTYEQLAKGNTSGVVTSFVAPTAGCLVVKGKSSGLDITKYIFLPFAGSYKYALNNVGSSGYYWSRNISTFGYPYNAYYLRLTNVSAPAPENGYGYRIHGMTVRPVRQ